MTTHQRTTMKQTKTFEVGEQVKWWSHGGKGAKVKEGVIHQVLQANEAPSKDLRKIGSPQFDYVRVRDHRSYIIKVLRPNKRSYLYWPVISKLQPTSIPSVAV